MVFILTVVQRMLLLSMSVVMDSYLHVPRSMIMHTAAMNWNITPFSLLSSILMRKLFHATRNNPVIIATLMNNNNNNHDVGDDQMHVAVTSIIILNIVRIVVLFVHLDIIRYLTSLALSFLLPGILAKKICTLHLCLHCFVHGASWKTLRMDRKRSNPLFKYSMQRLPKVTMMSFQAYNIITIVKTLQMRIARTQILHKDTESRNTGQRNRWILMRELMEPIYRFS